MIKFIIVANKRTGSTYLQHAINSHPNIRCLDEMFLIRAKNTIERDGVKIFRKLEKDKGFSPREYIEWLGTLHNNVGFRIVYPQLDHWKNVSDYFVVSDMPIIHLIRSNYFEQAMSWFTKQIPNKQEKLYVDPTQLKNRIEKISFETEYYRRLFKNNRKYIEILYEDMFGKVKGRKVKIQKKGAFNIKSKQKTYLSEKYKTKICSFIDVSPSNLSSNLTKRTKWDVWEYIKNSDEIKNLLINEGWERFIREGEK